MSRHFGLMIVIKEEAQSQTDELGIYGYLGIVVAGGLHSGFSNGCFMGWWMDMGHMGHV